MIYLALDTSTTTASVAVIDEGSCLAKVDDDSGDHSDKLLGLVASCIDHSGLRLTDIEAIAVGAGPGSFTGLRIGLATAKGLALAREIPLYAVSSLAALAAEATPKEGVDFIAAIVNAHRKEVFVGVFDAASRSAIGDEQVFKPEAVAAALSQCGAHPSKTLVVGEGALLYPQALDGVGFSDHKQPRTPPAVGVAAVARREGRSDELVHSTPSYIRPAEAEVRFPHGNPGGTFAPQKKKSREQG